MELAVASVELAAARNMAQNIRLRVCISDTLPRPGRVHFLSSLSSG